MIKIILAFILLSSLSVAKGQYVNIPDSNFRYALISQGFASCFDITQTMLDTTCSGILDSSRLNVSGKGITSLEGVQYFKHLTVLYCSHNRLTLLPKLPDSISGLYCFANQIGSLPQLPNGLKVIDVSSNSVHSLPSLPESLISLDCAGNPIDSFPSLPNSLNGFSCGGFRIRYFPSLPASLRFFWCIGGGLDSLPLLPDSLASLKCAHNNLIELLPLPSNLSQLDCGYNQLNYLPALPDSLVFFYCNNNPQLSCLPHLSRIVYLDLDSTAIRCLPNRGNITQSYPSIILPICSSPCYPLGIQESFDTDIKIYPNPTTDKLYISNLPSNSMVNLCDMTGRILSTSIGQEIDVSALPVGVYFLRIQTGKGLVVKKFVKE